MFFYRNEMMIFESFSAEETGNFASLKKYKDGYLKIM
jgi:hypothetical protein